MHEYKKSMMGMGRGRNFGDCGLEDCIIAFVAVSCVIWEFGIL